MNKKEITLEEAEDIVDKMYQNRFDEAGVDEVINGHQYVHLGNLDRVKFNKLEKASILLLRTELHQKYLLDKKDKIINDIKFYIEQSDIANMLWGKEILKIIGDEE